MTSGRRGAHSAVIWTGGGKARLYAYWAAWPAKPARGPRTSGGSKPVRCACAGRAADREKKTTGTARVAFGFGGASAWARREDHSNGTCGSTCGSTCGAACSAYPFRTRGVDRTGPVLGRLASRYDPNESLRLESARAGRANRDGRQGSRHPTATRAPLAATAAAVSRNTRLDWDLA